MILYKCTLFSFSKKAKSVGKTLCLFYLTRKLCNNHRETDTVSVDTVFPFVPEFTGIFFGLVNWSNNDGYILVLDENGSGLGSAQTTSGSPATLIFPFEKGKKILLGTHRNINGFYSISKVQFK